MPSDEQSGPSAFQRLYRKHLEALLAREARPGESQEELILRVLGSSKGRVHAPKKGHPPTRKLLEKIITELGLPESEAHHFRVEWIQERVLKSTDDVSDVVRHVIEAARDRFSFEEWMSLWSTALHKYRGRHD